VRNIGIEAMSTRSIQEAVQDIMVGNDLSLSYEFVPFSRSRNAKEKSPSLNWVVTLKRGWRVVLSTDYSAGMAHCPAYSAKGLGMQNCIMRMDAVKRECETGHEGKEIGPFGIYHGKNPIKSDVCSVMYCLVSGAAALDAGGFEGWAADYGYDIDSRSAEATYRACLDTALKLRAGIGDDTLSALREALQDY
jgi:hypothetical protein